MSAQTPTYSRLTFDDRLDIQAGLKADLSFFEIAKVIDRAASTVAREVKRNRTYRGSVPRHIASHACCKQFAVCQVRPKVCSRCKEFVTFECTRMRRGPYVCNACAHFPTCSRARWRYLAREAQSCAEGVLRDSRRGVMLSEDEFSRIDDLIFPLVRQKQSLWTIAQNHAHEIPVTSRTLYRWVDQGYLRVIRADLKSAVTYRPRSVYALRQKPIAKEGRTYHDYCALEEDVKERRVEIDCVMGKIGRSCLLTIYFAAFAFQLAYKIDSATQRNVTYVIDGIEKTLGAQFFCLFPVILTDNGPEFRNSVTSQTQRNAKGRQGHYQA